jgi:hypothetical protein
MKSYNSDLDEIVWEESIEVTDPWSKSSYKQRFIVRVMQYNGGRKKLDIKRLVYGRGNEGSFSKSNRYTKDELQELLPVIKKAMEIMN